MPKIKVEIQWDKPKEKPWLTSLNIWYCLQKECKNTKFKVKEIK